MDKHRHRHKASPSIRFKEFDSNWQIKKLGDLLKIGNGRDYKHLKKGDIPVYGTGGIMLYVNDCLYDGKSIGIGRKGTIDQPQLLQGKFWTVDTLFYTHDFTDSIPEFLYAVFQRINWQKWNEASGVPSLSKTTIESIKVAVPELAEQQKIASFLTAIDQRITNQQQKLSLLKDYKKGVMQKLFTQQVRFKDEGGDNYPDWEEKKAGELFVNISNRQHNGDLPVLSVTQDDGIVRRDSLDRKIDQSDVGIKNYKIIEPDDFVISLRSFQGGIEKSDILGISSPAYTILRSSKEIVPELFKHYFKREEFISRLNSTVIGIRDGKQISYEPFSTLRLPIPYIEEQRKIASFLSALDDKIKSEESKLTNAKKFKTSLLQKMFV